MNDSISRQGAIDAIMQWESESFLTINNLIDKKVARAIIEDLPSTQPDIIRCKDCKYWDTTWQNDYVPNYHYCPMIDGTRRNDFYCAYAERKEETT